MTIDDIMQYVTTVDCVVNPVILRQMIAEVASGSSPDLSHITATADKILINYEGVDTTGARVYGTCEFNAKLPVEAFEVDPGDWGHKEGQTCLELSNGVWQLATVE